MIFINQKHGTSDKNIRSAFLSEMKAVLICYIPRVADIYLISIHSKEKAVLRKISVIKVEW